MTFNFLIIFSDSKTKGEVTSNENNLEEISAPDSKLLDDFTNLIGCDFPNLTQEEIGDFFPFESSCDFKSTSKHFLGLDLQNVEGKQGFMFRPGKSYTRGRIR